MSGVVLKKLGAPEGLARRFLVTCMIVGFAALALAGIAAAWVTTRTAEHTRWVNHTYEVEVAIGQLQALVEQTEAARRGYVLTGIPAYLDNQRSIATKIDPALDRLTVLTEDNPRQRGRIAELRQRIVDIRNRQEATIDLVQAGKRADAVTSFTAETSARRLRTIRALFATMNADEHQLLVARDAAQQSSLNAFYLIVIAAGVLILLVATISVATVMRYTKDLGAARDRLQLLNTDLEGAVAERTADLTRANEEIQRFAYIVSHDLRSPLVNVMGFTAELDAARGTLAELVERATETAPDIVTEDARIAATEDLPEAIGFIRSSTQKMDRLINAILRLSREGRRTLTPERLDLAAMSQGIADSLRHIAEDRGAQIVVEQPMPTLVSDRVAVEQILSNLVENAVKYLSPDRAGRIIVRARTDGPRRVIEVTDNGRGIAANDHDRVFDLFRRSGTQDQQGEGIGLAHVRALAYRLGGTIDLQSTLGQGSTFRVTLPATLSDTGPST
ncbi:histidine kinase [Sphingomonas panacisoli]|uniref:histidine kinase n=1 Tax=Sphingomonas panacisoli TaxID=1813879 RepID=A0A5B8LN83_9SPHN|nr:CHASE3 domain-containing protein [Sphingomonas panacisoli]QDZ08872.1 histidine kinase [Sphingomonas panacisoli]